MSYKAIFTFCFMFCLDTNEPSRSHFRDFFARLISSPFLLRWIREGKRSRPTKATVFFTPPWHFWYKNIDWASEVWSRGWAWLVLTDHTQMWLLLYVSRWKHKHAALTRSAALVSMRRSLPLSVQSYLRAPACLTKSPALFWTGLFSFHTHVSLTAKHTV